MAASKVEEVARLLAFWFSDANLSKDRFLLKQIEQDAKGCEGDAHRSLALTGASDVPLSVFLTFNKIKRLDADINDLKAAAKTCKELKVGVWGEGDAAQCAAIARWI